jgi:low temperature requirement protein LtrA
MHAPDDNTIPTTGSAILRRLIRPWEFRHARTVGSVRFVAGGFQLGVGLVLLSLGRKAETDQDRRKCFRWSAWFLVMAALQLVGGCLDMAADRSARVRD